MVIFDPKMTQKSSFFAEKCRKSITNLNNARSQRPGLVSDQGFTSMAREARRRTGQLDAGDRLFPKMSGEVPRVRATLGPEFKNDLF